MNKTEAAYANLLKSHKQCGSIEAYGFESMKLRLAKRTWYTPDFAVIRKGSLEFHEVKGFWEDDARVKIKVAAAMFPHFKFVAIQRVKGEWVYETFCVDHGMAPGIG